MATFQGTYQIQDMSDEVYSADVYKVTDERGEIAEIWPIDGGTVREWYWATFEQYTIGKIETI